MFQFFQSLIDPFKPHKDIKPPKTLLAFYWHYCKQVWPILILIIVLNAVYAVIEVMIVTFLGKIIDLAQSSPSPGLFFSEHGATLLTMAFIALIIQPINSLLTELVEDNSFHANFATLVRWQTHQYVKQQSLSFFQNDFAGRIASKIQNTGPALRQSVRQTLSALVYTLTFWLGTFGVFASLNIWLALPLLLWFTLYGGLLYYFVPKIRATSKRAADAISLVNGHVIDNYSNISTVKLFAGSRQEDEKIRGSLKQATSIRNEMLRLYILLSFILHILNNILLVGTVGLALWLWQHGLITLGMVALTLPLIMQVLTHSNWVMGLITNLFENIGQVEDGMETIAQDRLLSDAPDAKPLILPDAKGQIAFKNVSFQYSATASSQHAKTSLKDALPSPATVLDNISFTIQPGEKIGLVGASGAGKSTLVHLLLRFYDLKHGEILVGGQNIANVTQDSLCRAIAMVSQDTSLLHRSIAENLRYGNPGANQKEMTDAARQAQAHDFILGLTDNKGNTGYDAIVGERGVKLSGGQRQRIAIARLLLKDAPVLVLDEATSALDSEAEAAIQQQLTQLFADKTVIAIAHRLSTIAQMDRLIVLERGRIAEQGTHQGLLKQGGIYAKLWSRQSGGFIAE